jgi:DNA-binding MarR family transcriptional regulator
MYDIDPSPERDVLAAVNEVPRAFFRLSAVAETIFADLGVSPGERGVLRELFVEGQDTAPSLAQRKPVSRQAMQAILDGLAAKGLVRIEDNPRHKRSKFYSLAPQGIDLCVELQKREIAAIREVMGEAPTADFAAAAAALQTLNRLLARKLSIG